MAAVVAYGVAFHSSRAAFERDRHRDAEWASVGAALRPAHARGDVRLVVAAAVRGALRDQAAGAEFSCECVEHVPKDTAPGSVIPGLGSTT